MLITALCPAVHEVPAAIWMIADHMPLAQRWKEVPPTQFQSPSLLHAVPAAWAPAALPELGVLPPPLPEDGDDCTGAGATATELEAGGLAGAGAAATELEATGVAAGAPPAGAAWVMKTPPAWVGAAAGAVLDDWAAGAGGGAAADGTLVLPEPELDPEDPGVPQPAPTG